MLAILVYINFREKMHKKQMPRRCKVDYNFLSESLCHRLKAQISSNYS